MPFYTEITEKTSAQDINQSILILEQKLNAALLYIPTYDVQRFTNKLKSLKQSTLKPIEKKKFSFKSKSTVKPSSVTVSSETSTTVSITPSSNSQKLVQKSDISYSFPSSTLDSSQDVYLLDLINCIVDLTKQKTLAALYIQDLTGCIVICEFVAGSILFDR